VPEDARSWTLLGPVHSRLNSFFHLENPGSGEELVFKRLNRALCRPADLAGYDYLDLIIRIGTYGVLRRRRLQTEYSGLDQPWIDFEPFRCMSTDTGEVGPKLCMK
jgi:hypothetical protein